MSIWKKDINIRSIELLFKNTIMSYLDIKVIEIDDNYIKGTMPVNHTTQQSMGVLHGGASVVLAESLGSVAANYAVDKDHYCVGLDINANHLAKVSSGLVTAIAKPVHLGSSTQVWEINIMSESQKLTCVSRLTMAVLKNK